MPSARELSQASSSVRLRLPKFLPVFTAAFFSIASLAPAADTIKSKVVDEENHSVTETISDAHGKLQKKTVFYFDDNNWSKGAVHYTLDNTIRYKETFMRDSKGLMLQTWLYSKDDKVLGHRVFRYDGSGKLERIDDFDANGQQLVPTARPAPTSPGKPDKKKR